jgi:hypothetical protein
MSCTAGVDACHMNLRRIVPCIVFVAAILLTRDGRSEPAEDRLAGWHAAVAQIRQVMDGTLAADAIKPFVTESAWIQPFDMNRTESATRIADLIPRQRVVSARGYLHPSVTAATEMIQDLSGAGLDETLARQVIITDPASLRIADQTMARWFSLMLEAQPEDPVACIVLYDDGAADLQAGRSAKQPTLTFVLVRGTYESGTPRVSRIVFGPMDAAAR